MTGSRAAAQRERFERLAALLDEAGRRLAEALAEPETRARLEEALNQASAERLDRLTRRLRIERASGPSPDVSDAQPGPRAYFEARSRTEAP